MVIDLHFVAVIDGHPLFPRLNRNAYEDSGIVVRIAHAVDDAKGAVAELLTRPIEKSHAAVGLDQAIFHGHVAGADMLPSGQVFAVEQLFRRL